MSGAAQAGQVPSAPAEIRIDGQTATARFDERLEVCNWSGIENLPSRERGEGLKRRRGQPARSRLPPIPGREADR